MKKLLSLGLAIVMMLSCVLVQTVAVSAAEAVASTNAPYAGVYQVTSDKAVTLTNETGHTVTLAAGANDYFYLIKGANNITTTDASATVTYTALANNGMDYLAEVDAGTVPLAAGDSERVAVSGGTGMAVGAEATATLNIPASGLYYVSLQSPDKNVSTIHIESDTGFYGEMTPYTQNLQYAVNEANPKELITMYLRAGTTTLTLKNLGAGTANASTIQMKNTAGLTGVAAYIPQLNIAHCKVVEYVEEVAPTPTEEPVVTNTITYTAPYAGVYQVTSDKAVTLTNETGHTVTLAAGATDYFYLIKGINTITTTDAAATLTFTELEENGMDYIAEVDAGTVPLAGVNSAEVTLQNGIGMAVGAKDTITLEVPVSGLYYVSIWSADKNVSTIYVESDTGFCGEMTPYKGGYQYAVNEANPKELITMYLRQGTTTLTVENLGSGTANIKTIQVKETNGLKSIDAYIPQLNIAHCIVAEYVESSEPTPTPTPTLVPAVTVTAEGAYAGVYEVTSDKDVTITNFTGHTATLTAGATEYFYLVKGANTIATTDETATLTFTELEDNGMEFLAEVDAGVAPLASGEAEIDARPNLIGTEGVCGDGVDVYGQNYVQLDVNASMKVKINAPETGIYYLQIQMNDASYGDTIYMETDTGFCGTMLQYQWGWHFRTNGASDNDLTMVFLREGEGWLLLENQGPAAITIGKIALCQSAELNDAAKFPQYADQLDMDSCDVVIPAPDTFINETVVADGSNLTFGGRIGADWMEEKYGVEIDGKKFFGARPGDTVSDGNGGTTVFEFDGWDGTFEIILTNITEKGTAGEKTYRFFVGENYTEAATVEVAAAE